MATVGITKTSPKTVVRDYRTLMHLANYEQHLPKDVKTIIKINLSWSLFYPACSSPPWQLKGVVETLRADGYRDCVAVENQTVVTHPWKGAYNNKWLPILRDYQVPFQPLTDVQWVKYTPKSEMLAMYDIFDEIFIPSLFQGTNMIHLPTVKTHGHTQTTGAMKNAFGGLIPKYRHHAHKKIHEILVDLLSIQHEIHRGIFAAMDGCVCGDGAGPRTMKPVRGDILLASSDQVAIDAIAAKIMGFDPLTIGYIKMAHDIGLGIGDIEQIEINGMDKSELSRIGLSFTTKKSPIIAWDQIIRKRTAGVPLLHNFLFYSKLFKLFIFASEFYHDQLWYPTIGKKNIRLFERSEWGRFYESFPYGPFPEYEEVKEWSPY